MIMFSRKYKERFDVLADRINEQRDEINTLRLELEAYRDHGVYIGKRYQHKDGGAIFEMNADTYLNIERSNTFLMIMFRLNISRLIMMWMFHLMLI